VCELGLAGVRHQFQPAGFRYQLQLLPEIRKKSGKTFQPVEAGIRYGLLWVSISGGSLSALVSLWQTEAFQVHEIMLRIRLQCFC